MSSSKHVPTKESKSFVAVQQYSGPMPDPSSMEHYEQILPGSAERLLTLVEKQTNHRLKMENKTVNWNLTLDSFGLLFAFIIVLVILLGSFYLMYHGIKGSSLILGVPVVLIVAYFITRRHKKQ